METIFRTFQSAAVTLKIRSRSPKSNQLVPFSQQCIYASLVKIYQTVQKIRHGKEATWTPTGSTPSGLGDIKSGLDSIESNTYCFPVLMKLLILFPLDVAEALPPRPTTTAVNTALLPPIHMKI